MPDINEAIRAVIPSPKTPIGMYLISIIGITLSKSCTLVPAFKGISNSPMFESASAIIPGITTRAGRNIFGRAPISGVFRAADIEPAAMARCTTRKLVVQYPKESTKPRPKTTANHSTPSGLASALPVNFQECIIFSGRLALIPSQPPISFNPIKTSGAKPTTIKKNCSTSL